MFFTEARYQIINTTVFSSLTDFLHKSKNKEIDLFYLNGELIDIDANDASIKFSLLIEIDKLKLTT
jgi:hypothetical protein